MASDLWTGPQWVVSMDDVHRLAPRYGWDVTVQDLVQLAGAVNGVVSLTLGDAQVIVRVHRPWTSPARLDGVHRVFNQLRHLDLPVPEVVQTIDGKTFVELPARSAVDGPYSRLIEVHRFVTAQPERWTRSRAGLVCAQLAPLHRALAEVDAASLPPPDYAPYANATDALAMLAETGSGFLAHADEPRFEQALEVRLRARAVLEHVVNASDHGAALPVMLIHGDPGFGNVLVNDGAVVAIIDFDFMAVRPRVFDLAYCLYHVVSRVRGDLHQGALIADERRWLEAKIRQYGEQTHTPLTRAELVHLPFEMATVTVYQAAEAGYRADAVEGTLYIRDHMALVEWIANNADALATDFIAAEA